jgi:hypothetical protein
MAYYREYLLEFYNSAEGWNPDSKIHRDFGQSAFVEPARSLLTGDFKPLFPLQQDGFMEKLVVNPAALLAASSPETGCLGESVFAQSQYTILSP